MVYNTGTATDYLDMLDQLIEVLIGDHVDVIVLNNAGTGGNYLVGEVLSVAGGTSTNTAQIEILTISGSQIATARIYRGGTYTSDPGLTGNAVTGSATGTGATFDLTMAAAGWIQLQRNSSAKSSPITVSVAGNGYNVSDVLTLVGGVLAVGGSAATFTVASLTGGAGSGVASVTLTTAGAYEVSPDNAALTTNDGGGDDACTLTIAYENTSGDTVVTLQGDAGAAADPLVGIRTYSTGVTDVTNVNTVSNWALHGITSWSPILSLHLQNNVSPGFSSANDGAITTTNVSDGAFMPLTEVGAANAIQWSIRHTGRMFTLIARVEGASTVHSAQCSAGLLNPLGITNEFPFPAYVAASAGHKEVWYADTTSVWGGLSVVMTSSNAGGFDTGPMFVWTTDQGWISCRNAEKVNEESTLASYSISNRTPFCVVFPLGTPQGQAGDDIIAVPASTVGFDSEDFRSASPDAQIYRTPDTGGDLFPLYPISISQHDFTGSRYRVFGEIDGLWWVSNNDANFSSQDRLGPQGQNAFTIFQNGTEVQPQDFLALEES